MSDAVIRVENLSKRYVITHQQVNQNPTLKDAFAGTAKSFLRRLQAPFGGAISNATKEEFWALKDIGFQIAQGERVGIIGRNGAGKSTLLKILSRITEPTKGRVAIKGRVASLLEVGTGFHPELTGRENIYLNGAVLGMSRTEIKRKFDEIVDFAEVEKFLDTPVKRYSSGMYVRLAFAVAAHLEPEILIIDEVLAVGDVPFQKKCLGKMEHVANEGRTVLFVSHNMPSILSLTRNCILMEKGGIATIGETDFVVGRYLKQFDTLVTNKVWTDLSEVERDLSLIGPKARLQWVRISNAKGEEAGVILEREPITIEIGFKIMEPVQELQFGCTVRAMEGQVNLFTTPSPEFVEVMKPGDYSVGLDLNPNHLRNGDYMLILKLFADGQRQDHVSEAVALTIQPGLSAVENRAYYQKWVKGYMRFDCQWRTIENKAIPSTKTSPL